MALRCYRLLTYKFYFDVGFGQLNYVKYFLMIFGAYSVVENISLKITFALAFIYALVCFVFGRYWVLYLKETENQVANDFNPFCKDVLNSIKKRKV